MLEQKDLNTNIGRHWQYLPCAEVIRTLATITLPFASVYFFGCGILAFQILRPLQDPTPVTTTQDAEEQSRILMRKAVVCILCMCGYHKC